MFIVAGCNLSFIPPRRSVSVLSRPRPPLLPPRPPYDVARWQGVRVTELQGGRVSPCPSDRCHGVRLTGCQGVRVTG